MDSPSLVAMYHVSPSSDWRLLRAETGNAGENWTGAIWSLHSYTLSAQLSAHWNQNSKAQYCPCP